MRVRLKSGDIYRGTLKSYPLSKDDAASKDFLLSDGEYLPAGDETRLELLNSKVLPGFGGILLNSKDVDAIELIYAEETP